MGNNASEKIGVCVWAGWGGGGGRGGGGQNRVVMESSVTDREKLTIINPKYFAL